MEKSGSANSDFFLVQKNCLTRKRNPSLQNHFSTTTFLEPLFYKSGCRLNGPLVGIPGEDNIFGHFLANNYQSLAAIYAVQAELALEDILLEQVCLNQLFISYFVKLNKDGAALKKYTKRDKLSCLILCIFLSFWGNERRQKPNIPHLRKLFKSATIRLEFVLFSLPFKTKNV